MTTSTRPANVGYLQVLRQNPDFRNLWIGQLISAAGDWFNNVAVLGMALSLTGNGFAAGMVLLTSSIPHFLMIPIAGPVADRFDRRKIMLAANFLGALCALSFLLVRDSGSLWILFAGMLLLVTTAAFFNPASQSSVPNLTRPEELATASTLSGSTWGIMVMVGSAVGGIFSQFFGRDAVFIVNAASFVLANFFIWQIKAPTSSKKVEHSSKGSFWHDFRQGLGYVRKHLPVMTMVAVKSGWSIGGGVLVLLSVFGNQVFNAGDAGIGILYAGRGLGALAGPFMVKSYVEGSISRMRVVIFLSFMISGVGYLVFAWSASVGIWLAFFALVVGHLGGGINWIISSVLLQYRVDDSYLGRVFSLDIGMSTLTASLSTLIFSLSLNWEASPVLLAVIGGAVFALYGLLWGYISRHEPFKISEHK